MAMAVARMIVVMRPGVSVRVWRVIHASIVAQAGDRSKIQPPRITS
jgi:hypothetical protein